MKYIIWGCGKRGTALALLLGLNKISVFIDNNAALRGSKYMNIPIIGFEDCLELWNGELIIIAVKGCERSIGKKLDQIGIPWLAIETPECVYILNQIRLVIEKILIQDDPKGASIVYGWNVYGLYVYELLRAHDIKCRLVVHNDFSEYIFNLISKNLSVTLLKELKSETIERIFLADFDVNIEWNQIIYKKITRVYEIYKEFDLFYNPDLKRFYNIHKGKRCFIVATGPSLRIQDLITLKAHNEICMSVNGIFKAFKKTLWRPDYYFLSDLYGVLQWSKDILQMDVRDKFIADTGWWFDGIVPCNIHRYHVYENCSEDDYPKFTEDFSKCAYISNSIVYDGALQMAVYMGFSNIYLIGADCTVEATQKKQHFIEDYEDDKISKSYGLDIPQILKGYESAKKYCRQHGINLYNATRGGSLDVLERVDFDSLF